MAWSKLIQRHNGKFGRSWIPRTATPHTSFIVLRCMWKEPAPYTSQIRLCKSKPSVTYKRLKHSLQNKVVLFFMQSIIMVTMMVGDVAVNSWCSRGGTRVWEASCNPTRVFCTWTYALFAGVLLHHLTALTSKHDVFHLVSMDGVKKSQFPCTCNVCAMIP